MSAAFMRNYLWLCGS